MFNRSILLLLLPILVTFNGCQSSGAKDENPAKSDQWKLMTKVSGHDTRHSERFEANGNQLMLTYEAKATGAYEHCHLEVYMVKGIETTFTNPVLTILNREEQKGKKLLERQPGKSYYLRVKPLEMHYSVKVYQKQDQPTSTT